MLVSGFPKDREHLEDFERKAGLLDVSKVPQRIIVDTNQ